MNGLIIIRIKVLLFYNYSVSNYIKHRKKELDENIKAGKINNNFVKPINYKLRELDPNKLKLYQEEIDFLVSIEEVNK